jgi:hypothetical protein
MLYANLGIPEHPVHHNEHLKDYHQEITDLDYYVDNDGRSERIGDEPPDDKSRRQQRQQHLYPCYGFKR